MQPYAIGSSFFAQCKKIHLPASIISRSISRNPSISEKKSCWFIPPSPSWSIVSQAFGFGPDDIKQRSAHLASPHWVMDSAFVLREQFKCAAMVETALLAVDVLIFTILFRIRHGEPTGVYNEQGRHRLALTGRRACYPSSFTQTGTFMRNLLHAHEWIPAYKWYKSTFKSNFSDTCSLLLTIASGSRGPDVIYSAASCRWAGSVHGRRTAFVWTSKLLCFDQHTATRRQLESSSWAKRFLYNSPLWIKLQKVRIRTRESVHGKKRGRHEINMHHHADHKACLNITGQLGT